MRRAARRWGRGLAVAACLLPAAYAQTVPTAPAQTQPDSIKKPTPTFVADTARRIVVVSAAEPTNEVTRRTGLRIGAAIVVLTLTTLLLYNVRSR
ncbi:hypothetical protein [Hymenobacter rubidus]|uniref:hypothetical protein n=1 Tax=Hymenobacter rubidus TaxID=1441626 RepID=UPI00191DBB6B|nr:hypothetical protein [Hymenobacter rubidus]